MAGNFLKARLRVRWPDGDYRGFILHPSSWSVAIPFNDVPSLELDYHPDAPNARLLNRAVDVALEVYNANAVNPENGYPYGVGAYQEFPNCRFINVRQSGNLSDREGTWKYAMPGYAWMLRKARNIRSSTFDKNERRTFKDKTIGNILQTFLHESRERKNLLYFTENFNSTTDSAGKRWKKTYTMSFDAGQDLWSIVENLSNKGMCDWRMNKRTLEVYNPNTALARDFTGQNTLDGQQDRTVVLRTFFDVIGQPTEVTREDLARKVFVHGDKKKYVTRLDDKNPGPWGAWEEYLQAGGISSTGTLGNLGDATLVSRRGNPDTYGQRVQLTKDMHTREGSKVPLDQYRPGDFVAGPGWKLMQPGERWTESKLEKLRVQQITLTYQEPYGISCNVVLNDKFADRNLRRDRWVNRIVET